MATPPSTRGPREGGRERGARISELPGAIREALWRHTDRAAPRLGTGWSRDGWTGTSHLYHVTNLGTLAKLRYTELAHLLASLLAQVFIKWRAGDAQSRPCLVVNVLPPHTPISLPL